MRKLLTMSLIAAGAMMLAGCTMFTSDSNEVNTGVVTVDTNATGS